MGKEISFAGSIFLKARTLSYKKHGKRVLLKRKVIKVELDLSRKTLAMRYKLKSLLLAIKNKGVAINGDTPSTCDTLRVSDIYIEKI